MLVVYYDDGRDDSFVTLLRCFSCIFFESDPLNPRQGNPELWLNDRLIVARGR